MAKKLGNPSEGVKKFGESVKRTMKFIPVTEDYKIGLENVAQ